MLKYGVELKINVILLIGVTTFIPKIFSLDHDNLRSPQNQKYDFIDVAKETAGRRSKGQTTRILTTDDELDEKFWLKYLGVDFRDAVQLHVDSENNVIPLVDVKPPTLPTRQHKLKAEKRTRYVRQPTQEENDKQLPVENLDELDVGENQDTTQNLETFDSIATITTTTALPPANKKQYSNKTRPHFHNKKPSKRKDKLLPGNKNIKNKHVKVKSRRSHKAVTKQPVAVTLPQPDESVDHMMQIPPVVYRQKVELYPENQSNREFFMQTNQLLNEHSPGLYLKNQNEEFYSQPSPQYMQLFYPPHIPGYATNYLQTYPTIAHKSTIQTSTTTRTPSYPHKIPNT